jgi:hypothetical protein
LPIIATEKCVKCNIHIEIGGKEQLSKRKKEEELNHMKPIRSTMIGVV